MSFLTAECNACVESDGASCNRTQTTQYCATSERSLGTTHCASAVGKFRDKYGSVLDGFYRGCVDCAGKQMIFKNNSKKSIKSFRLYGCESCNLGCVCVCVSRGKERSQCYLNENLLGRFAIP